MGPLHGPMKEHSGAMVIGDCKRTKKVGDCMQAMAMYDVLIT